MSIPINPMAKFSKAHRLPKEKKQKVLLELCTALVMVKKLQEAAKLLGDLLSDQEIEMVGKRLQIAKLLLREKTYEEIMEDVKVSAPTIARVNLWLQQAGEGFRMVMKRGLAGEDMKVSEWMPPVRKSEMARRFPLYYWPQGLLEDIIRIANNRQRKRMLETISILRKSGKGKREVFRYLESLIHETQRSPRARPQFEKEMQFGNVKNT